MIDTLVYFDSEIMESEICKELNIIEKEFILATFHRPSNVDGLDELQKLIDLIHWLTQFKKVVLPLHPRTKKRLIDFNLFDQIAQSEKIVITPPLGYFAFQRLIKESFLVITDSGGIQEETTFRQVPCLTLRENTERPITILKGTNTLVSFEKNQISALINEITTKSYKVGEVPPLWDGNTTSRILDLL
jgi:UDP-N-acetylglucosamine 2-epimerase (non-hydrolysing)